MSIRRWIGVIAALGIIGTGLLLSNNPRENEPPESHSNSDTTLTLTRDDIVGQWRSVVENPAHKNTIARRYMRHTFFLDGELVVENEENSSVSSNWEYDNGTFVVTRTSGTSEFVEHFKMIDHNTLEKILFQSVVNGEPLASYNPEDQFIRQGSNVEESMKIIGIFETANSALDFIDPNSLAVGSSYTLSRQTPVMPNYVLSDLAEIGYAQSGQSIEILEQKLVENIVWYRIETGDREGWVNSIALFGQELN